MKRASERLAVFVGKHRKWLLLGVAVLFLLFPLIVQAKYPSRLMCVIIMYATLAGTMNVVNGYSGQFCIGFAGFICVGAYVQAILSTALGWSFWPLLLLGGVASAFVGFLVSLPTLRLSGIYLSVVTIGASEVIRLIALNWTSLTGGAHGIRGIPAPRLLGLDFSDPRLFYYIFLGIGLLFLVCTYRVLRSRVGRAWLSIRENQTAARSLGIPTSRYKSVCFVYSAFWAGLCGAAYASFVVYMDSTYFSMGLSTDIISMALIGGTGTLAGPVVGAFVVQLLSEGLRPFGVWRYVVYAALIILMMWVRPQGLSGSARSSILSVARDRSGRKAKRRVKKPEAAESVR
ncbi:MAG: branched-chain amino acid ABC transporter permease [Oscillospiraceae bacterium]|jgi:branched-chain amino acid transport system permease protein|nr:branched-chain amino acid ABC transporter permease [Oscillospiraceae bacterium]